MSEDRSETPPSLHIVFAMRFFGNLFVGFAHALEAAHRFEVASFLMAVVLPAAKRIRILTTRRAQRLDRAAARAAH